MKEVKNEQDGHRSKLTERQDKILQDTQFVSFRTFYKIYNKEIQFLVWRWSELSQNFTRFVLFTRLHVDEVKMFEDKEGTGQWYSWFCKVLKGRFGWTNWTLCLELPVRTDGSAPVEIFFGSDDMWKTKCSDQKNNDYSTVLDQFSESDH